MLKRKRQTPEQRLNADELEVIRLLVTGLNGSEIAQKQKVDTDRVYQNLRTARSKLGVQTIAQLAAECVRRKIVA
jgi:DNA-binding CsgD family transcriptional regulator